MAPLSPRMLVGRARFELADPRKARFYRPVQLSCVAACPQEGLDRISVIGGPWRRQLQALQLRQIAVDHKPGLAQRLALPRLHATYRPPIQIKILCDPPCREAKPLPARNELGGGWRRIFLLPLHAMMYIQGERSSQSRKEVINGSSTAATHPVQGGGGPVSSLAEPAAEAPLRSKRSARTGQASSPASPRALADPRGTLCRLCAGRRAAARPCRMIMLSCGRSGRLW